MKKLKSVEDHEAESWRRHEEMQRMNEPHPNGLACPKCGQELWDSTPMLVLTSNPPRKNVHCPACSYRSSVAV